MTQNGRTYKEIFGIISKDNASAADYAAAYRKVLSGPPGTVSEFVSTDSAFGSGQHWLNRVENDALETLQIGGEARPTVRVVVTEKGIGSNYFEATWRRWFDVQTGAVIRQAYQPIHGQAYANQDWTAASIVVAKP